MVERVLVCTRGPKAPFDIGFIRTLCSRPVLLKQIRQAFLTGSSIDDSTRSGSSIDNSTRSGLSIDNSTRNTLILRPIGLFKMMLVFMTAITD